MEPTSEKICIALRQHLHCFFEGFHWKYVFLNLEYLWLSLHNTKNRNFLASKLQKLFLFWSSIIFNENLQKKKQWRCCLRAINSFPYVKISGTYHFFSNCYCLSVVVPSQPKAPFAALYAFTNRHNFFYW